MRGIIFVSGANRRRNAKSINLSAGDVSDCFS